MSDHFGFGARFIATNFKSASPNVKNMGRGLSVSKVIVWRGFRRPNWPGPLIFDMVFFDMGRSTFVCTSRWFWRPRSNLLGRLLNRNQFWKF